MLPIPSRFFVTVGKSKSKVSELNAFDQALIDAKIGELNLVSVSSILPAGIKKVPRREIPMGSITHCVLAQQSGNEGEMISAGIAYAFRKDGMGGYVAEGHLYGTQKSLREILEWKINEMAKLRDIEFGPISYKTCEMSVPMDHYGVCLASLVYLQ